MDVIAAKVLSGFLFFLLALVFGWLPFCLYQRCSTSKHTARYSVSHSGMKNRTGDGIIQCLHALASGVLIATCLLHLLPESLEAVEQGLKSRSAKSGNPTYTGHFPDVMNETLRIDHSAKSEEISESDSEFYPVAELLVALGFIFIYVFDSTVKSAKARPKVQCKYRKIDIDSSSENEWEPSREELKEFVDKSLPSGASSKVHNPLLSSNKHYPANSSLFDQTDVTPLSTNIPHCNGCDNEFGTTLRNVQIGVESDEIKSESSTAKIDGHDSYDVRSAALVMALCVHGFFDGVILGLQTSVSVILSLLFALSLHKSFVALSLSLTLVKNYSASCKNDKNGKPTRLIYLSYVIMFASVAPIGIITSAAFIHSSFATSQDDEVSLVPGCLQAFAVGTFFYVTFTETTGRHGKDVTLWSEVRGHISLVLGFSLMAILRAALGET